MAGGGRFEVRYSGVAAAQIEDFRARSARSPGTRHEKTWLLLRQVLVDALPLSMVALERQHALKNDLANVWRIKTGRWRVCYLVASTKATVIVLMVGFRKEGDKNDAYEELRRYIRRGTFDEHFVELGVSKPKL